jgi:hypothetical protein
LNAGGDDDDDDAGLHCTMITFCPLLLLVLLLLLLLVLLLLLSPVHTLSLSLFLCWSFPVVVDVGL